MLSMSTSSKKSPIFLEDVDIDNISVSNKISLDKKMLYWLLMIIKLSHYT